MKVELVPEILEFLETLGSTGFSIKESESILRKVSKAMRFAYNENDGSLGIVGSSDENKIKEGEMK